MKALQALSVLVLSAVLLPIDEAKASIVNLNLREDGGAGAAFELSNGTGTYSVSGVTFSTLATGSGPISPRYGAGPNIGGVTSGSEFSGGPQNRINEGETLSFTLTFVPSQWRVTLVSVTFQDLQANNNALVTISGNSTVIVPGEGELDNVNLIWSPNSSISSGDSITFGVTNVSPGDFDYGLVGMSFDITAIPEPTHVGVLAFALIGAGFFVRRRAHRGGTRASRDVCLR